MAIKPKIVQEAENRRYQAQRAYEDNFTNMVRQNVYNHTHSPQHRNLQAITFYANSQEEMEEKIEDWLRKRYVERLHIPKKKRWWVLWK